MTPRRPESSNWKGWGLRRMSRLSRSPFAALLASLFIVADAKACMIFCRPTEENARAALDNLIASRYRAPFDVKSFEVTRKADFDLIAGEMRGFDIFFKAEVEFPQGANLDCSSQGGVQPAEDCSPDTYFSLIRETRPKPGRQYIAPGAKVNFDEDMRFAEIKGKWKGPDGKFY